MGADVSEVAGDVAERLEWFTHPEHFDKYKQSHAYCGRTFALGAAAAGAACSALAKWKLDNNAVAGGCAVGGLAPLSASWYTSSCDEQKQREIASDFKELATELRAT
jgi:hypothetical protein